MKTVLYLLSTVVMLTGTRLYAQDATTAIMVKEHLHATGHVEVFMSVYDQPQGGSVLYQVTQTVSVSGGQFVDILTVPTALLAQHPQVFIECAQATAPTVPLGEERMQFTQPPTRTTEQGQAAQLGSPAAAAAPLPFSDSVCYTCGGAFPFQTGAVATRTGGANIERGRSCGGNLRTVTYDNRPFLCFN